MLAVVLTKVSVFVTTTATTAALLESITMLPALAAASQIINREIRGRKTPAVIFWTRDDEEKRWRAHSSARASEMMARGSLAFIARHDARIGMRAAVVVALTLAPAMASVYQYSAAVEGRRAFLWIPPRCSQVRGIVISFSNLLERNWLEDPIIREEATSECLAIVWVGPGRSALIADMKPGAAEKLEKLMEDLANETGYGEIRWAPFISMGHSANGQLSWNIPNWAPERTIAAIPIKTVPLPQSLGFTGVPLCYLVGETTEWPQYRDGRPGDRDFFWPVVRDTAIALRGANRNNLIGVVTDPGGGHFDWSERQARFVALYIRKACRYRLPKQVPASGPVKLKPLLADAGWLTDTAGMDADRFRPAPYLEYKGDSNKAYWFFDEETARAAVAFCGDRRKRDKQMLTFVQDGESLPVAKQGFAPIRFQPLADGRTFRVEGVFLPVVPPELIGAGTKLGHSSGPIRFRVITGPAVQTGPDTFRVQFDRAGMGGVVWCGCRKRIPAMIDTGTPCSLGNS